MEDILQLLGQTADGAFVVDSNQQLVFWNKSAQKLIGLRADEVLGRHCYHVIAGRDETGCAICRRLCTVFVESGREELVPNFDVMIRTKEDEPRWLNVSIIAIPGQQDKARAVIHLFRDITAKKQVETFALDVANRIKNLQLQETTRKADIDPASTLKSLTARETQVLRQLARGEATESIAAALFITDATVRNHIQHILSKLGVHSRLEAVLFARQHGLD